MSAVPGSPLPHLLGSLDPQHPNQEGSSSPNFKADPEGPAALAKSLSVATQLSPASWAPTSLVSSLWSTPLPRASHTAHLVKSKHWFLSGVQLFVTPWTGRGPLGSLVHGILQARILEGIAIPSSRGSS